MAQQTINVGSGELAGDGESLRSAFQKINSNFSDLYTTVINTGTYSSSFIEGKSFFVNVNGDNANDGRSRDAPVQTIGRAVSSATSGDTIYIGPGVYAEGFPLTVPAGVTIRGSGIRATTITPTNNTKSNDGFLLNGQTTLSDFNITGQFWNTLTNTGYAFRIDNNATFTTRSPYLERITILNRGSTSTVSDPYGYSAGDAGRGIFVDGSVVNANSVESALLINEFTMIVPGSIGLHITNGARIEMLTSFTYFAEKAIWAESGSAGRHGDGKTKLRLGNYAGPTLTPGIVITQTSNTGSITTATIESYNTSTGLIIVDGKIPGFEEYDDEAPAHQISLYGNATYSVADKKFGISSLKFDNPVGSASATGYVIIEGVGDLNFNTNNFTIEFYFQPLANGVDQYLLSADDYEIIYTANQSVQFVYRTGGIPGASAIVPGPFATGVWHYVSISKQGPNLYTHVNGSRYGTAALILPGFFNTTDIKLGAFINGNNNGFTGYIDFIRVSKNIGRYDLATYTPPSNVPVLDNFVIIQIEETANSGIKLIDSAIAIQNITLSNGYNVDFLTLVDYKDFGAEVRAIACANVYGQFGAYADGLGNLITLMSHNFSYIGELGDLSNDPDLVNQNNEVVALNGAKIYYNTIDQRGDVRIGDFLLADQQRGKLTFSADTLDLYGLNNISFNENGGIIFGDGSVQITSGSKNFSGFIYVDKSGNDATANGSSSLPFKTIQAAHDYAKTNYKNTFDDSSNVIICINPGLYNENLNLTRPRTHLIGVANGITRSVTVTGNILIASTATGSVLNKSISIYNINSVATNTNNITISGTNGYQVFLNNLRVVTNGTNSSSISSESINTLRVTLDKVTIIHNSNKEALYLGTTTEAIIYNSSISAANTSTIKQIGASLDISNSYLEVSSSISSVVNIHNGIASFAQTTLQNGDSDGNGIYIGPTGFVNLINSTLNIGADGGSGTAIDGNVGGICKTGNLIYSLTSNKNVNVNVTQYQDVVASGTYQNILPAADLTYDLGSTSSQWRSLYVGTSTIYIGGTPLTVNASGSLTINGNEVTGGGVSVSDTPPADSAEGSTWWDIESGQLYIRYSGAWVEASPTGQGNSTALVSDTASTATTVGSLWWDTNDGRLYIKYDDAWVEASPSNGFNPNQSLNTDSAVTFASVTASVGTIYGDGTQLILSTGIAAPGSLIDLNGGTVTVNAYGEYFTFSDDGNLTFPSNGGIVFDSSATSTITGVTNIVFADGSTQASAFTGTSALLDITNTNGLATTYYLTFVENRTTGQEVRADVDLTYETADNILGVGRIQVNNSITFSDASTQTTAYVASAEPKFNIVASSFTAAVNTRYGVSTTATAVTVNLPPSPSIGDAVFFADAGGNFSSNNLTINRNGNTIMGAAANTVINVNGDSLGLFWNGSTWRLYE